MTHRPRSIIVAGAEAEILDPSDSFHLHCTADGCSSNCCTKSASIVLNPYEISLLCRESKISYEDLLDVLETERANSFPLVMLPRDPACHFWTGHGCAIYTARPLACRLFPLGRVFDSGKSHLVRPFVNVCTGLAPSLSRTVADYLVSQDAHTQIGMADVWIDFVSEMERLPLPDSPVTSVAFHMLVYSPDTPPAPGMADPGLSPEDCFKLRLKTAKEQLPGFLRIP